jgi:hypothetical protein
MNDIIKALSSFKQDLQDIKASIERFEKPAPHPLKGVWLDGQEVIMLLHISKRNLQNLRDNGTLPYSRIKGKFYYKSVVIELLLERNYKRYKSRYNNKSQEDAQ